MDPGDVLKDKDDRDDRDLHALFAREPAHFPEQPFVNELARRVADERRRRAIVTRVVSAVAVGGSIAALIATAPWLISGSALISARLDTLFAATATAIQSPFGYVVGIAVVVAAAVFRRRLLG
jgi:hypothetical protein